MRRITKVIAVIVVVGLFAFFFFAPVFLWGSVLVGHPATGDYVFKVYRSLGCATVGFGVLYSHALNSQGWLGFSLGCDLPFFGR
ncbi:MAG: hypothetical protein ABSB56_07790 [Nitrososphaerales archaeon]|jgi:hypothetical protein